MREAGVTLVTRRRLLLGAAGAEPRATFELRLARPTCWTCCTTAASRVDLATATASPPPWLSTAPPRDRCPVDADGTTALAGWPAGLVPELAGLPRARAGSGRAPWPSATATTPPLVLWHVSNELGGHNAHCYCDVSAPPRSGPGCARATATSTALNDAWGTAFWSQRYTDWEQILPPRTAPTFPNPTQQLDFARFSSDALLAHFCAERDVLHRLSPGVPVTTNFMVMEHVRNMDYFAWAPERRRRLQRPLPRRPPTPTATSSCRWAADLTRGLARRQAVVADGALDRARSTGSRATSPSSPARCAATAWPTSRAAPTRVLLLPVAGLARRAPRSSTRRWCRTPAPTPRSGARSSSSAPMLGSHRRGGRVSRSVADVAIVCRLADARWAGELDSHPSADVTYLDRRQALYRALWDAGVTADIVAPGRRPVGLPARARADALPRPPTPMPRTLTPVRRGGGTALVTYLSGIVDENDHVRLGGYPGAFRDLLGVRTEEFYPLRAQERVASRSTTARRPSADVWTELLHAATVPRPCRPTPTARCPAYRR